MAHRQDSLRAYPAEKARGADKSSFAAPLCRPWQRAVFIAGLAGCVLLLLITLFFPGTGY
jgi:hypothetical protein